jgi:hypothetical protein
VLAPIAHWLNEYTDKKKKLSSSKEIQNGAVAKSYMRKGFPIYEEMIKYLTIYEEAVSHIYDFATAHFLVYEEIFIFFFIIVRGHL